jgi:hypothetical protein
VGTLSASVSDSVGDLGIRRTPSLIARDTRGVR